MLIRVIQYILFQNCCCCYAFTNLFIYLFFTLHMFHVRKNSHSNYPSEKSNISRQFWMFVQGLEICSIYTNQINFEKESFWILNLTFLKVSFKKFGTQLPTTNKPFTCIKIVINLCFACKREVNLILKATSSPNTDAIIS